MNFIKSVFPIAAAAMVVAGCENKEQKTSDKNFIAYQDDGSDTLNHYPYKRNDAEKLWDVMAGGLLPPKAYNLVDITSKQIHAPKVTKVPQRWRDSASGEGMDNFLRFFDENSLCVEVVLDTGVLARDMGKSYKAALEDTRKALASARMSEIASNALLNYRAYLINSDGGDTLAQGTNKSINKGYSAIALWAPNKTILALNRKNPTLQNCRVDVWSGDVDLGRIVSYPASMVRPHLLDRTTVFRHVVK